MSNKSSILIVTSNVSDQVLEQPSKERIDSTTSSLQKSTWKTKLCLKVKKDKSNYTPYSTN